MVKKQKTHLFNTPSLPMESIFETTYTLTMLKIKKKGKKKLKFKKKAIIKLKILKKD